MDDKKKKFVIPDAEVVDFAMEDIVTTSTLKLGGTLGDFGEGGYDEDF